MDLDNRYNDYELLYMIYQMDEESLSILMKKYLRECDRQMQKKMYWKEYNELVEEMMLDTAVLLYESIYFYRQDKEARFSTYFHRIFEYKLRNYYRKKQTYKSICRRYTDSLDRYVMDDKETCLERLPNTNMNFEGKHTSKVIEIREVLEAYLKRLDPLSWQIVMMRIEGWPYHDIAMRLNIDRRQAEYVVSKARKHKPLIDYLKSL